MQGEQFVVCVNLDQLYIPLHMGLKAMDVAM